MVALGEDAVAYERGTPVGLRFQGLGCGGLGVKGKGWWERGKRFYLSQCINEMVFESQPPPQNRQLIVYLVNVNNKLTILWGS